MSPGRSTIGPSLLAAALAAGCSGDLGGSERTTDATGSESDTTGEGGCAPLDPRLAAEVSLLVGHQGHWKPAENYPFAEHWLFFGVRDLSGIECIPDLVDFRCYECPVEDLSPLAAIDGISRIEITGARVKDLGTLAGASTLEHVALRGGILEDVDALLVGGVDFPALTDVDLADNQLSDDLAAPNLPALRSLDLSGNLLTRLPAMDGLPTLERLVLSDNAISDIAALSALTGLRELEVARAELTALDGLVGLPIERLDLSDNHIVDPSPIALMPRVIDVDLARNEIVGLAGVLSSTLQRLVLTDNPLQSVAGLAGAALVELDVSGGELTSFDGLVALGGVGPEGGPTILAEDNAIVDLSGLALAPVLGRLALSRNPVDLTTLPAGMKVERLELKSAGLTSLAPLATILWGYLSATDNAITALPVLEGLQLDSIHFDLSGNAISDLSPLAGRQFFYRPTLILADNAISDLSPIADVRFVKDAALDLSDNAIADISPLATIVFNDGAHLKLGGNPIASLAPLAVEDAWLSVDLSHLTAPVDLAGLAGARFRDLDLSNNGLVDITALAEAAPEVSDLDLSKNAITVVPSTATWPVHVLHLDGNPLTSLGMLPASLEAFTCAGCSLTSLAGAFDQVDGLSVLDLSNNPLNSIEGLSVRASRLHLDGVKGVDFARVAADHGWISARGCEVDDLSPFVGRGGADLRDNPVRDLSPIAAMQRDDDFVLDESVLDLEDDDLVVDLYAICLGDVVNIDIGAIHCERFEYDGD